MKTQPTAIILNTCACFVWMMFCVILYFILVDLITIIETEHFHVVGGSVPSQLIFWSTLDSLYLYRSFDLHHWQKDKPFYNIQQNKVMLEKQKWNYFCWRQEKTFRPHEELKVIRCSSGFLRKATGLSISPCSLSEALRALTDRPPPGFCSVQNPESVFLSIV